MVNKRQSGFTLIEVLVSMVILAIGLLGVAGLQATALSNNQSAYYRSQATQVAYEIADRIRSNPAGDYNNKAGSNDKCDVNPCTPSQMVGYDLTQWNSTLLNILPNAIGVVCIDSTPEDGDVGAISCDGVGNDYAVKIWWDDDKTGINKQFVTSFTKP